MHVIDGSLGHLHPPPPDHGYQQHEHGFGVTRTDSWDAEEEELEEDELDEEDEQDKEK